MAEHTNNKQPFYKKWWVWLIAVIVIIALVSGGDEEDNNQTALDETETEENQGVNEEEVEEPTNQSNDDSNNEDTEDLAESIEPGTYKVGEDIPAGEYVVFSDGMGYIESAYDSTGELESIIFNDNLMNGSHPYVTVQDGEYFKLQGAKMYPVESAPSVQPADGIYRDGMYKVGTDIPAGEYKVIFDSDIGMGYLEVSKDSRHTLESIITNENLEADSYITVEDGQYLKLQDVYIEI